MDNNLSKLEVDFYRLLVRCESLATEDVENLKSWRVKAYVSTLRNQFVELKKKPSSLNLRECGRRLENLQSSFSDKENVAGVSELSLPGKLISSSLTDTETAEKDMKHKVLIEQEMRQRLLHSRRNSTSENSKPAASRHSLGNVNEDTMSEQLTKEEVDRIVEQHRKIQEHQIDQLVNLVRDLKESANDANRIVRQDNKTLTQTNQVASRNMDDLSKQKRRLDDAVAKSGTLWQWLLIGFVVVAFIGMILFMKLFRKR